ncbi:hypothetical protein K438DRAFT_1751351 [Mycena galopus ATCC 62051]|nr:hypothetical protein K438DRAFT_1751351 [Mycena galopus ATCC 62051]
MSEPRPEAWLRRLGATCSPDKTGKPLNKQYEIGHPRRKQQTADGTESLKVREKQSTRAGGPSAMTYSQHIPANKAGPRPHIETEAEKASSDGKTAGFVLQYETKGTRRSLQFERGEFFVQHHRAEMMLGAGRRGDDLDEGVPALEDFVDAESAQDPTGDDLDEGVRALEDFVDAESTQDPVFVGERGSDLRVGTADLNI